jgi:outer membrane protein assembly factor BamB
MPWRRAAQLVPAALLALLPCAGMPRPLGADAGSGPGGAAPLDNSSHVHDDEPWVRDALERAEAATAEGRFDEACERLQRVVDRRFEDEAATRAAPYVAAVGGQEVFEGAWLVARHRLASGPDGLREAYAARYGAAARALLVRAGERLDDEALAELARRFLPLADARLAVLLLADRDAERGDHDAALGRLEALEDVEEVSAEDLEELAPWRRARLEREARWTARSPDVAGEVLAHLVRAAEAGPRAAALPDRVPAALLRPVAPVSTWPTTGGGPARGRVAPAQGAALAVAQQVPLVAEEDAARQVGGTQRPDRPSPWLPPRAVVSKGAVFVNDGEALHVLERGTGEVLDRYRLLSLREAPEGEFQAAPDEDTRDVLPLAEGHALTVEESTRGPTRVYACVMRRTRGRNDPWGRHVRTPFGQVVCLWWDGGTLMRRWTAGVRPGRTVWPRAGGAEPTAPRAELPEGLALFGAPCLAGGLVWVAGVRGSEATGDRQECWLVGLDPDTGAPTRQVRLGSGSPIRLGRADEAVPSSCAAARGRVVVSTALGWVAAVDAEDGRIAWIFRYDRGLETGRVRRLSQDQEDGTPRLTGFANEPPLIAFGLTLVAPTDSNHVYGLATRPRGRERFLEVWDPLDRRRAFPAVAVEQIVGAAGGTLEVPPTIVVVGKGESFEGVAGQLVLGLEPRRGHTRWKHPSATGQGSVPYGRAALTEREAFVPTRHGILRVDLAQQRGAQLLTSPLPGGADVFAYGNLVPLPGEGLVAANLTHVTLWRPR